MSKNRTVHGVVLALAMGLPVVGMAEQVEQVRLSCPAGTKQFGGRETMTDRGVFCVKRSTSEGMPVAHGPYVSYHLNGQKKVVGQHADGAQSGVWTFFDENGVKTEEIEFVGGNYHGRRLQYFGTGVTKVAEHWVAGKREGSAVTYAENGQKLSEQMYRAGHAVKTADAPAACK
ncbi:hypothetical protein HV824_34915 [Myxococcus sp. AM009]|uniref:toxin-antitoxin system YwqK family antitoxin n=1 Tax=Myxococcus sp. AM009 TaxID=2745137 RepID=UPI0015955151|nr:hypothetical protein [Myxococcus sp. AM009]NVJ03276.1 hypothetical protein [Myxococcus sp. AM009]